MFNVREEDRILQQHVRQHPMFNVRKEHRILCRTRQNPLCNENVTSELPSRYKAQKTLRAFANIHRRPTKLGSILRMQKIAFPVCQRFKRQCTPHTKAFTLPTSGC